MGFHNFNPKEKKIAQAIYSLLFAFLGYIILETLETFCLIKKTVTSAKTVENTLFENKCICS